MMALIRKLWTKAPDRREREQRFTDVERRLSQAVVTFERRQAGVRELAQDVMREMGKR